MSDCTFPKCGEPAVIRGLCRGHDAQERRHPGQPLQALRGKHGQLGDEPLTRVSLRLPRTAADLVHEDVAGARKALEAWAKKKTTTSQAKE